MKIQKNRLIEILDEIDNDGKNLRAEFRNLRGIGKIIRDEKRPEKRNEGIAIYSRMLKEIVNSLRDLGIKLNGFITEIDHK